MTGFVVLVDVVGLIEPGTVAIEGVNACGIACEGGLWPFVGWPLAWLGLMAVADVSGGGWVRVWAG